MYSEWVSVSATAQVEENRWSVLHKLQSVGSRDVVLAVVRPLAEGLGIGLMGVTCEPSKLATDKDVQWCMEVICYGLGLPLSEQDAIKDCVNIYCEWLQALTKPRVCVPLPVKEDPNTYARKIIQHLFNLFVPREDAASDSNRQVQVIHCHRVLRTLQSVAQESTIMNRETWDALLLFLLAVNDTLLASPSDKVDETTNSLCERILSVLFEIWLLACHKCFPSPPLWKTFRDMCCSWRHRLALVDQWNRVNIALTSRVIHFMYGPLIPEVKVPGEDNQLIPPDMSNDSIAQAWFRFLHLLGNPVDLCRPEIISQTPKFYHYALSSETVIDPCQHPCLAVLPQIFLKAMHGLSVLVNIFLGIEQIEADESSQSHKSQTSSSQTSSSSATPPHQRQSFTKSLIAVNKPSQKVSILATMRASMASSASQHHQAAQQQQHHQAPSSPLATPTAPFPPPFHPHLSPARPKCNSLLHLLGSWLFEASLIGSDLVSLTGSSNQGDGGLYRHGSFLNEGCTNSPPSLPESIEIPPNLTIENFEAGQAEAVGALCRLFCAKRTGEDILSTYLARFYLAIQHGLTGGEKLSGQVLSSILVNSSDLLRQDLSGVMSLVPAILQALELVLPAKEPKIKRHPAIPQVELRRSSIHLLLSMLTYPLHFGSLPIRDMVGCGDMPTATFQSLRPRLVNLLINALKVETDSHNTHMLLGGLLFCVQDSAACEEVEQVTDQPGTDSADVASSIYSTECSMESSEGSPAPSLHFSDTSSLSQESDSGSFTFSIQSEKMPKLNDSAHALFVQATYLVCHRLISTWKTDLNVSLAALEVLSGLARIHLPKQENQECKTAVKWICDYIVYLCSRPPPAHSKDLHSTIVAAYQCVTTWLTEHPDLLNDKDCVHTVLEVVELGISGSKSRSKDSEPPRLKGDKEPKPASKRVRDEAEAVMSYMMDRVGYFPYPSGPETCSFLLDELSLLQQCNWWNGCSLSLEDAVQHFRYFVVNNSIVLALLEQNLGNDQNPQPTVTALIRGPFGRHGWTMQLRHLPRSKMGNKWYCRNPPRPFPNNYIGTHCYSQPRFFPEAVDHIPLCNADLSIPFLEAVTASHQAEHDKLKNLVDSQILFEETVKRKTAPQTKEFPNPETECTAPALCQEFQTARLLLSHLGFLSLESLKESSTLSQPSLLALNRNLEGFQSHLAFLDKLPSRTSDTVFVFYVKKGQTLATEILGNVSSSRSVHPHFMEFLLSLGWPVNVWKHPGWTGHVSTSWKILSPPKKQESVPDHGGSLYNGQNQVLYWADVASEIAFVVPSHTRSAENSERTCDILRHRPHLRQDEEHRERHMSGSEESPPPSSDGSFGSRTMSLTFDSSETGQGSTGSGRRYRQAVTTMVCDVKVAVVWLECFEDYASFPISDLSSEMCTGLEPSPVTPRCIEKEFFVIFVHALESGLFRIKMQGPSGKMNLALPLVDGMVVSRRTLGTLVRQTALNLCRRRRLAAENHLSPHVRRRYKIQEIVEKYGNKMSEPEFYTALFAPAAKATN